MMGDQQRMTKDLRFTIVHPNCAFSTTSQILTPLDAIGLRERRLRIEAKFGQSKLIDLPSLVASCKEKWNNLTISQVNDSVVRLGVIEGEYHWHQHEREDEFFFVVDGKLLLDLENKTVELLAQQGYTVPKGVVHRTRAPERTVILMIEQSTIKPEGD